MGQDSQARVCGVLKGA
jgi:hypothetical protein